jgi:Flp pilus assembly protein TadG
MKSLKNHKGQSLVEFAIILPLLLLLVIGIIEFGMMLNSYLAINNAAREGARAGIVGSRNDEIQNLILSTSPALDAQNLKITITPSDGSRKSGDTLTVAVTYNYYFTIPILGGIFNNAVPLNAQVSMRIE